VQDVLIAVLLTALSCFVVYLNLGKPPITGIDDENITQVYGRNMANGFGYVYTPHFEHVEGATSPLWVAVHYLFYKVSDQPEPYVLGLSLVLGVLSVYWLLGIARCTAAALGLRNWTVWIPVLALAAYPDYFAWTVLTMMDQGVWSTIFLALVYVLIKEVSDPDAPERVSILGLMLCVLGSVTRPEAMLLLPLMLALAGVVVAVNKGIWVAARYVTPYLVTVAVPLVALTVARKMYFGYPLPNTYYAKVSSHLKDNIVNGLLYLQSFVSSNVLSLPSVMAVILALLIGIQALLTSIRGATRLSTAHAVMLLVGGFLAFVIGITVLEGGDHFAGFRMLQPYMPLACIALMFYVPVFSNRNSLLASRFSAAAWVAVLATLTLYVNHSEFKEANREEGIKEEFTLARHGRLIGELLNTLAPGPLPAVGVLPAGGVALAYNGRVADLLGLNWVEMAHASTRRIGLSGHSAFEPQVFWKYRPEIMVPQLIDAKHPFDESQLPSHWDLSHLKGLMNEQRFRDEYRPVLMHLGDAEIFAYVRNDFADRIGSDPRIVAMTWERFRPIPQVVSMTAPQPAGR
jgi:hypothetical protein